MNLTFKPKHDSAWKEQTTDIEPKKLVRNSMLLALRPTVEHVHWLSSQLNYLIRFMVYGRYTNKKVGSAPHSLEFGDIQRYTHIPHFSLGCSPISSYKVVPLIVRVPLMRITW